MLAKVILASLTIFLTSLLSCADKKPSVSEMLAALCTPTQFKRFLETSDVMIRGVTTASDIKLAQSIINSSECISRASTDSRYTCILHNNHTNTLVAAGFKDGKIEVFREKHITTINSPVNAAVTMLAQHTSPKLYNQSSNDLSIAAGYADGSVFYFKSKGDELLAWPGEIHMAKSISALIPGPLPNTWISSNDRYIDIHINEKTVTLTRKLYKNNNPLGDKITRMGVSGCAIIVQTISGAFCVILPYSKMDHRRLFTEKNEYFIEQKYNELKQSQKPIT